MPRQGPDTPTSYTTADAPGVRPGECDRSKVLGVGVVRPAQPAPSPLLTLVLQRSPARPAASG